MLLPRRPHPVRAVPRRRIGASLTTLIAATLTLTSCAIGPNSGPDPVTGDDRGDQGPVTTTEAPQAQPLQVPTTDLDWSECRSEVTGFYRIPRAEVAAMDGVTVECAEFTSDVSPDQPASMTVTIALTRLRAADTPADAAPLVLTSGVDMPSSRTALILAAGAGRSLLSSHPVVAVDRRGIERSTPIDCMIRADREALADNGFSRGTDVEGRIDDLADAATSAADSCTETLEPHQLDFGIADAAYDLEMLRSRWDVEQLGLIGVGEGSDVVIAYSSLFGGRAGRIILDTPTAFDASTEERAEMTAAGVQAALARFGQRCLSAQSCPLGDSPLQVIERVIDKAADGRLGNLSDTAVLAGITTAIATAGPAPESISSIASVIAAADRGTLDGLNGYAQRAAALRLTDGQLLSRCNDSRGQVGRNTVPDLIARWSAEFPLTGADTALSLVRCNGWGSVDPLNPPQSLPVDPLILTNTGDPINGTVGAGAVSTMMINAEATPVTVSWEGLGYSVLARSSCAADTVTEYIATTPLQGPSERACPA